MRGRWSIWLEALEFGSRKVRWPGRTESLTLVVVDGLGRNPLMLLTNRQVTRSRKSLWRVEETIRFIKQSYGLEDIQVRKYERLRNLAMLVFAMWQRLHVTTPSLRLSVLASEMPPERLRCGVVVK